MEETHSLTGWPGVLPNDCPETKWAQAVENFNSLQLYQCILETASTISSIYAHDFQRLQKAPRTLAFHHDGSIRRCFGTWVIVGKSDCLSICVRLTTTIEMRASVSMVASRDVPRRKSRKVKRDRSLLTLDPNRLSVSRPRGWKQSMKPLSESLIRSSKRKHVTRLCK